MTTQIISDLDARKLASYWHNGQTSALYALLSTGTISNETVDEINDNIYVDETNDNINQASGLFELDELYDLRDYCQYHGIRGPQDGWSNLIW